MKELANEKAQVDGTENGIPAGVICMWSGASTAIPAGWALCNGTMGTPDLRDRFIVGAGHGYNVGDTGGHNFVELSVKEMPEHTHKVSMSPSYAIASPELRIKTEIMTGHLHGAGYSLERAEVRCESRGWGDAHENRPPYYALCFIMKL